MHGGGERVTITPETIIERAVDCAHDYLVALLDRSPRVPQRDRSEDELYSSAAIGEADEWLALREQEWQAAGRLNTFGYLRVGDGASRWTISAVRDCFPKADPIACVIALNGVIEESEMKEIVSLIRRIVREELQVAFSESHAEARESRSALWAGRATDGAGRRRRKRSAKA